MVLQNVMILKMGYMGVSSKTIHLHVQLFLQPTWVDFHVFNSLLRMRQEFLIVVFLNIINVTKIISVPNIVL